MERPPGRSGPRSKNHFFLIVVVLAAAGALAAAGSGLEDSPERTRGDESKIQRQAARSGATISIAWGERPGSLDPALAVDRTAANLVANLFDPLVKLGPNLEPVPNVADGWQTSADGTRVTLSLRGDARWTNGDPVTAHDYEYAWKRVLSPELESPHAERLFPIDGAAAYHECAGARCQALARAVGVRATDDGTLVVRLVAARPWFASELADPAFLPVHRATVEEFGDRWTDAENIVTNGPFRLADLGEETVSLVKSTWWHGADRVAVGRVDGIVTADPRARLQAFDAGVVDALDGSALPAADLPALRERREYAVYPALGAYGYAFDVDAVRDVHQRRAMALAIDRRSLVENVVQADVTPATTFTPAAVPSLTTPRPASRWLPAEGDMRAARAELEEAALVKRRVTLVHADDAASRDLAAAVSDAWRELGIETTMRAGAPAADGVVAGERADLVQVEARYRLPEAVDALDAWTCGAAANVSGFCDPEYDALLARAGRERERVGRERLYLRAEDALSGGRGAMPGIPLFWHAYANLESLAVRDSFTIDPFGRIDLAAVDLG